MSQRAFYDRLKVFPKEISATKLVNIATDCLRKFKNDYRIGSFFQLIERRCQTDTFSNCYIEKPQPEDYIVLINDDNVFNPSVLSSIQENSEALSKHLQSILSLDNEEVPIEELDEDTEFVRRMTNDEVIFYAMQHDLPLFASIDGGLENGIATVSISIVAPHILDNDEGQEWQDRPAKVFLIRSWRLPRKWCASPVCINMAESLGLILGEYTIPSDLPVIYITDSNNARTLQRNIKHKHKFTHRKYVRCVQQGIEASIANHLDYLTARWLGDDQFSP